MKALEPYPSDQLKASEEEYEFAQVIVMFSSLSISPLYLFVCLKIDNLVFESSWIQGLFPLFW